MKEQEVVRKFCNKFGLSMHITHRALDIVSEIGELAKEILIASDYGNSEFKCTENMELEIGDLFFSFLCFANTLNVDVSSALNKVLDKYKKRYKKIGSIGSK